jgi:hypothetical protein
VHVLSRKDKVVYMINTAQVIRNFTWDCTVGAGIDPEETPEPTAQMCADLAKQLGHADGKLYSEELRTFKQVFKKCLQEIAQS